MPVLGAGAGVILTDSIGRVLVIRRREEDTWGIPGGGVKPGETWADAALRECREETGWLARIDGLLGVYSDPATQVHRYQNGDVEQFLGVIFLATPLKCLAPTDDEATELRWISSHTLPSPLFSPDVPILRDAFGHTVARPVIG